MSITLIIIILTCLISISAFSNLKLKGDLLFYPPSITNSNQYYRFVTHGFVHGDYIHLAFNMIALYSFGTAVETQLFQHPCFFGNMGKLVYVLLYITGIIAASIPDYIRHRNDTHYASLGASGAISAVIFSAIVLLPKMGIGFMFLPFQVPGYIFGPAFLLISAYLDKRGGGNVAHGAHFWGAVYGVVFTVLAVAAWGKIDIWQNFLKQLQAPAPFLPYCDI